MGNHRLSESQELGSRSGCSPHWDMWACCRSWSLGGRTKVNYGKSGVWLNGVENRNKPLTNLRVGVERLDMHDVTDSSSDDDHLPTITFAHTHNPTQTPVSEICVSFRREQEHNLAFMGVQTITTVLI